MPTPDPGGSGRRAAALVLVLLGRLCGVLAVLSGLLLVGGTTADGQVAGALWAFTVMGFAAVVLAVRGRAARLGAWALVLGVHLIVRGLATFGFDVITADFLPTAAAGRVLSAVTGVALVAAGSTLFGHRLGDVRWSRLPATVPPMGLFGVFVGLPVAATGTIWVLVGYHPVPAVVVAGAGVAVAVAGALGVTGRLPAG